MCYSNHDDFLEDYEKKVSQKRNSKTNDIHILTLKVSDYNSDNGIIIDDFIICIASTNQKAEIEKAKFIQICKKYVNIVKQKNIDLNEFHVTNGGFISTNQMTKTQLEKRQEILNIVIQFENDNFSFCKGATSAIQNTYSDDLSIGDYELTFDITERELI